MMPTQLKRSSVLPSPLSSAQITRHRLRSILLRFLLFATSAIVSANPLLATVASASTSSSQKLNCRATPTAQQLPSFATLVSDVRQSTDWMREPAIGIDTLVDTLAQPLSAYLLASPTPTLHERARQARVPVMMYHDILPEKQVFFDVTPEEFESHLRAIQQNGLTPISTDQLLTHLKTGLPLPEKPILLTFDDGYAGHYDYVYPLLKKYGYPATFSIYTAKVGKKLGRSSLTWEQLREMSQDPLVTIAAHSVTHPPDLTRLPDDKLMTEIADSKRILEQELGISIHYFTYPEGKYDARVARLVETAGYQAAFTMNDLDERFAGQSESLLAIARIGQSRLLEMLPQAWGGPKLAIRKRGVDFSAPIERTEAAIDDTRFIFVSGGKPVTIHAKSRYQVWEIIAGTEAVAAVDGAFFSLEFLDSNRMIGPVMGQNTKRFIPGNPGENRKLSKRPLVLLNSSGVKFVEFDPERHNSLEGVQTLMPDVTDVFVAAAWLVKEGEPRSYTSFGELFDFDEPRHRAFWGITQDGRPKIGVSVDMISAPDLGRALAKAGFRSAVLLDGGASTSLAYNGESQVGYTPRPVPHVVALVPSTNAQQLDASCIVATQPH
jgi:poly-beta-1,6-N-acetyl-D-glucosamine N-deacetylase